LLNFAFVVLVGDLAVGVLRLIGVVIDGFFEGEGINTSVSW